MFGHRHHHVCIGEDERRGPGHRAAWEGGRERGPRESGGPRHGRGPHFGRGGRFFENGVLRLVILALIAETPRHGYEVIKEIEERTGGAYSPSAGVVYPTLTLLEETGQVGIVEAEGNKKLYGITDAGRATIEENRAAIDAVLARFAEAGAARPADRDPRLVRAVENIRLALRLKTSDSLADERIAALAALLDETARRIETI